MVPYSKRTIFYCYWHRLESFVSNWIRIYTPFLKKNFMKTSTSIFYRNFLIFERRPEEIEIVLRTLKEILTKIKRLVHEAFTKWCEWAHTRTVVGTYLYYKLLTVFKFLNETLVTWLSYLTTSIWLPNKSRPLSHLIVEF